MVLYVCWQSRQRNANVKIGATKMARGKRTYKLNDVAENNIAADDVAEHDDTTSDDDATSKGIHNIDTSNRTVDCSYDVRRMSGERPFKKRTLFNFADVTERDMYVLAMYGVRVKAQSLLRRMSPDEIADPDTFRTVDVKTQIVDASRAPRDPAMAARRALEKLTPEAREQLLQQLLATMQPATEAAE